jgi:hypothetical protein
MFRRSMWPPSYALISSHWFFYWLLHRRWRRLCSSYTSVDSKWTTRRHIPEDIIDNHPCENLKSHPCENIKSYIVHVCIFCPERGASRSTYQPSTLTRVHSDLTCIYIRGDPHSEGTVRVRRVRLPRPRPALQVVVLVRLSPSSWTCDGTGEIRPLRPLP